MLAKDTSFPVLVLGPRQPGVLHLADPLISLRVHPHDQLPCYGNSASWDLFCLASARGAHTQNIYP